jgi:hypothetical protein
MDRLKEALTETDRDLPPVIKDRVEVVGLTIASCLNRASVFLNSSLHEIDYEILEKGKRSFINPKPFRVLVFRLEKDQRFADLEAFSVKLGVGDRLLAQDLEKYIEPTDRDGTFLVRLYRSGVFLIVNPPIGEGRPIDLQQVLMRISQSGVQNFDQRRVEKTVQKPSGEAIKIADYIPNPANDSTCRVDISPDEMKAIVRITPPKIGGRHLETIDVVNALKSYGVVIGFLENNIKDALMSDRYMQDILAAQGIPPKHGDDARIDFKVNIKKEGFDLKEDTKGKVDFKNLNLVENVVAGQILAEKIPAKKGVIGRTLFNRLIDARDGKDIDLKQGKGTILSGDKSRLIAEINGQVVFARDTLSVEPVYRVTGDVGPKTGNIMFLGSVVIGGNVLDNYEVKAAGNIEIQGAVQKAKVEAEGDIIIKQGITGKGTGLVETTGGAVMARFIQSAIVRSEGDVVAQEGILHSHVESASNVICNGRRAQIVGGSIRAGKEVRARMIGSQAYTATEIVVGSDPKLLAEHEEKSKQLAEMKSRTDKLKKAIATLLARKRADEAAFSEEQQAMLSKNQEEANGLDTSIKELEAEVLSLDEKMKERAGEGRVHAEKQVFPGVVIRIREAALNVSDVYNAATFLYDRGYIRPGKLEADKSAGGKRK